MASPTQKPSCSPFATRAMASAFVGLTAPQRIARVRIFAPAVSRASLRKTYPVRAGSPTRPTR